MLAAPAPLTGRPRPGYAWQECRVLHQPACWQSSSYAVPARPRRSRRSTALESTADISAGFLKAVSELALKTRLRQYQSVESNMDCTALGLLRGRVEAVAIRGKGWLSPKGLSARFLEVDLGSAQLDVGALLKEREISLVNQPTGTGSIVFNQADFANFLVHPFTARAAATAVQGKAFRFDRDSVRLETTVEPQGTVRFSGWWDGDGQRYDLMLLPEGRAARVHAALAAQPAAVEERVAVGAGAGPGPAPAAGSQPHTGRGAADLVAEGLTHFFNNLKIDLQGPELSYDHMVFRKGSPDTGGDMLDLRLRLRVYQFPPLNIAW